MDIIHRRCKILWKRGYPSLLLSKLNWWRAQRITLGSINTQLATSKARNCSSRSLLATQLIGRFNMLVSSCLKPKFYLNLDIFHLSIRPLNYAVERNGKPIGPQVCSSYSLQHLQTSSSKLVLSPFQIISHSNFLEKSKHLKFDRIYIIK